MSKRVGGALLAFGLALALGTWAMAQDAGKDAGAPKAPKPTVTLSIGSIPSGAVVYHGRKQLGTTPLSVTRKRDSGPLDLVVRRGGYLAVSTRAYTFHDDSLTVRLTPVSKASTLYGYKEPLPPDGGIDAGEDEDAPDGGVAAPAPFPGTPKLVPGTPKPVPGTPKLVPGTPKPVPGPR